MNLKEVSERIANKTYTPSDLNWLLAELEYATAAINDLKEVVATSYETGWKDGVSDENWKLDPVEVGVVSLCRYQEESSRTLPTEQTKESRLTSAVGLCGEAGEVADYIKKIEAHGHDLSGNKMVEEIGDVLWYLAAVCTYYNLSLNDAAVLNIKKLRARYPNGYSHKASRERRDAT